MLAVAQSDFCKTMSAAAMKFTNTIFTWIKLFK